MRVINLGVGAVVPEACWLLGELGAEVIKIESHANLDFLRTVTLEAECSIAPGSSTPSVAGRRACC